MLKRFFLSAIFLFSFSLCAIYAQQVPAKDTPKSSPQTFSRLPAVSLGSGMLSFFGDIGKYKDLTAYSNFRSGFDLTVEERLLKPVGVGLNVMMGKLSKSERSPSRNLNFESSILDAGVNVYLYLNNDFVMNDQSPFTTAFFGGFHYMSFNSKADIKDANGKEYYYWSDGAIRTTPQGDSSGVTTRRDYTYETDLKAKKTDSITYTNTTFTIPVGMSVGLRFSKALSMNLNLAYYFTMTDWIDDVSAQGKGVRQGDSKKDRFFYGSVALRYQFGKAEKEAEDKRFKDVNFAVLDKADADGDNVSDIKDECPDTPKGAKVDSKGCPLDSDNDGVPDNLDKEPKTAPGSIVDANGVTLKDDALTTAEVEATKREYNSNTQQPGVPQQGTASAPGKLPEEFKSVDKNNDGIISAEEISSAIDSFFDGSLGLTVEKIYQLIDFFFEQ